MKDNSSDCPFCNTDSGREVILENASVYCAYDKFPVSKGHVLVIPKKHCGDYFELTEDEKASCWKMLDEVKDILIKRFNPDGFNIGININDAAGQTINHVHIHLIPRYKGDVPEPEGGVRGVIPEKRMYKSNIEKNPTKEIDFSENRNIAQEETRQPLSFIQSKSQVFDLINRADDYDETMRLISKFNRIKKMRVPFYLKMDELDEIFHWKLRGQYNRQQKNIKQNTDTLIKEITQTAFEIESPDIEYTIELKLKALIKLHGVQIPVASAIMALCYPDKYCVIDFRGYRQIFGIVKKYSDYSVKEYIQYWSIIKQKADEFGVTPQEVDMAMWQYDIESHSK